MDSVSLLCEGCTFDCVCRWTVPMKLSGEGCRRWESTGYQGKQLCSTIVKVAVLSCVLSCVCLLAPLCLLLGHYIFCAVSTLRAGWCAHLQEVWVEIILVVIMILVGCFISIFRKAVCFKALCLWIVLYVQVTTLLQVRENAWSFYAPNQWRKKNRFKSQEFAEKLWNSIVTNKKEETGYLNLKEITNVHRMLSD